MFKVFLISLFSLFIASGSSFASEKSVSAKTADSISVTSEAKIDQELKALADEHYLDQIIIDQINELLSGDLGTLRRKLPPPDFSKPGGFERCQTMICTTLGSSSCRFQSDLDQAKSLCGNQYDESCMQNWCTIQIGSPCRMMSDFDEASQVCGEVGGPCLKSVCDRLGPNACRVSSDLKKVASVCRGFYDSSCIDAVCAKSKVQDCRSVSGLKEVAKACAIN